MTIKDPDHAVRVLEATIQFAEKESGVWVNDKPYLLALVEGAKAVLQRHRHVEDILAGCGYPPSEQHWKPRLEESGKMVFDLAQVYAPRMEEAGMQVPE